MCAEDWSARTKLISQRFDSRSVVPEQRAGRASPQLIRVELQPAKREQCATEVQADPPWRVESGRPCAAAVKPHVAAEVCQRFPRHIVWNAAFQVPTPNIRHDGEEHKYPEAAPLNAESIGQHRRSAVDGIDATDIDQQAVVGALEQPPQLGLV